MIAVEEWGGLRPSPIALGSAGVGAESGEMSTANRRSAGRSLMKSEIVGHGGASVPGANGTAIYVTRRRGDDFQPDIISVPEVLCPPGCLDAELYREACDWLRRSYEAGALIASVSSGAMLLAQSGLFWPA